MNEVLGEYANELGFSGDMETDIRSFFTLNNDIETLEHTLKVADEAERVARLYGADPLKARQAGLLHDISNVVPVRQMLRTAEELSIAILDDEYKYARIVHQKLSKAMAREIFAVEDPEILNAIECHTTLKPQAGLLDKVLFVSDKISWELPGEHPYLRDIRKKVYGGELSAGLLIFLNNIWEQRDKLKLVHPWLIAAREELLEQEQRGAADSV